MNDAKIKTVFEERDEAIRLLNKTSLELNKTKALLDAALQERHEAREQVAATEEALAQVQRESAELREKYQAACKVKASAIRDWDKVRDWIERRVDAPAGHRLIDTTLAYAERLEAAKKVADAAVEYLAAVDSFGEKKFASEYFGRFNQVNDELRAALKEYRALTEPPTQHGTGDSTAYQAEALPGQI